MMFKNYASVDTPITQEYWRGLTDQERLILVNNKISESERFQAISPTKAKKEGQVIVVLKESIPARKRGILLIEFERCLKDHIDQGINVWVEPIGDKNSLRNLRGIQIQS